MFSDIQQAEVLELKMKWKLMLPSITMIFKICSSHNRSCKQRHLLIFTAHVYSVTEMHEQQCAIANV